MTPLSSAAMWRDLLRRRSAAQGAKLGDGAGHDLPGRPRQRQERERQERDGTDIEPRKPGNDRGAGENRQGRAQRANQAPSARDGDERGEGGNYLRQAVD